MGVSKTTSTKLYPDLEVLVNFANLGSPKIVHVDELLVSVDQDDLVAKRRTNVCH